MPSGRHDRDQPAEPAFGPGPGRRRAGRAAARVEGAGPGRQAVPVARCPRILAADPAYRPRQGRRAGIGRPDLNRRRWPGGPPGHLARRLGRRRPAGRRHRHHPQPRRARSGWLRRAGRFAGQRDHRPAARAGRRLGRPQAGHHRVGHRLVGRPGRGHGHLPGPRLLVPGHLRHRRRRVDLTAAMPPLRTHPRRTAAPVGPAPPVGAARRRQLLLPP